MEEIILMILLSLYLCFLAARQISRRRKQRTVIYIQPKKTLAQIERERKQEQRKQEQIQTAELTIGHCLEQLEILERMHINARKALDKAQETVKTDEIFTAARTQKITEKHIRELEKAEQKILSLNAKITMYQIKLEKAQNIINSAGT